MLREAAGPLPVGLPAVTAEPGGGEGGVTISGLLRRHRIIVATTILLCALLGGLASVLSTPLYRATTVLEIQGLNPDFLKSRELDPISPSRSAESYAATEAKLIQSESLAQRVVKASNLSQRPEFFKNSPFSEQLRAMLGAPVPGNQDRSINATTALLRGRIKEHADGDSNLLLVSVDAPEPRLAAELAQTLSSEFERQEQEERWNSAARMGGWLTDQLEELRQRMEHSGVELQQYANSANLLYTRDGNSVEEDRLRQIQQELSKAQAERADKESQMNQALSAPAESLPLVLDDAPIREYKLRLADLQRTLADLNTTLTPAHYKVESVRAQMAEIESALKRERTNVVSRIRNEYLASVNREALLNQNYATQIRALNGEASRSVRYSTLRKQAESDQELYRSMLQKVKETSMLGAIRTNTVRVVDPAQPPDSPHSPRYAANVGLGTLVGIILSTLLVLLRERLNITIREPGEMQSSMNVRELGAIPSLRRDRRFTSSRISSGGRIYSSLSPGISAIPEQSLIAEAFRCTAASLLFTSRGASDAKVFLITSALAGVGKTTTAVNLGAALCAGGRRVALVDGDLRKARLHEVIGIQNNSGLADLLEIDHPLTFPELESRLTATAMKGLTVMTAGLSPIFYACSLESSRLVEALDYLRKRYDIVLVDSPPALQIPDARLLARACDAVILVGRAGQTKMKDVSRVAQLFGEDGRRVIGSILVDWDPRYEDPDYFTSYYRRYA